MANYDWNQHNENNMSMTYVLPFSKSAEISSFLGHFDDKSPRFIGAVKDDCNIETHPQRTADHWQLWQLWDQRDRDQNETCSLLPSGKHRKSYWKWSFIVDLSIKNDGSFHSYVTVYQRAYSILAPRHFENRFMFDPQPSILRTTAGKRGSFINPSMPRRIAVSPLHHDAQLKLSPKRRSFSTVKRWLLHLADFQCVLGRGHEFMYRTFSTHQKHRPSRDGMFRYLHNGYVCPGFSRPWAGTKKEPKHKTEAHETRRARCLFVT